MKQTNRKHGATEGLPMTAPSNDVAFFDMIHALLQEQSAPQNFQEKRRGVRRPYNCIQLLAPFDGRRLPTQADFSQVRCQDLSPQGFSYLAAKPPGLDYVVIALGGVPFTFFAAEIMRVVPQAGSHELLIGCRFLNRISGRD